MTLVDALRATADWLRTTDGHDWTNGAMARVSKWGRPCEARSPHAQAWSAVGYAWHLLDATERFADYPSIDLVAIDFVNVRPGITSEAQARTFEADEIERQIARLTA